MMAMCGPPAARPSQFCNQASIHKHHVLPILLQPHVIVTNPAPAPQDHLKRNVLKAWQRVAQQDGRQTLANRYAQVRPAAHAGVVVTAPANCRADYSLPLWWLCAVTPRTQHVLAVLLC